MSTVRVVDVDQDILDSARLTPSESKVEMAVHLYEQGRPSIGKARELAGMTLPEFRQLLASRRIPPHYDEADLDEDVATLRELAVMIVVSNTSPLTNLAASVHERGAPPGAIDAVSPLRGGHRRPLRPVRGAVTLRTP